MSALNVGDLGLIPGLGRSPGEGNGNPLQYSCLENSIDRGAWRATVHGVAKSRTQLRDFTSLHFTLGLVLLDLWSGIKIPGIKWFVTALSEIKNEKPKMNPRQTGVTQSGK